MDFHKLLLDVDGALGPDELKASTFLCADILGCNPNSVESFTELFSSLMDRGVLSEEQPQLLAELLFTIQQYRLLKNIGLNNQEFLASNSISSYRKLLYELSESITDGDLKSMKFMLSNLVPRKKLEENFTTLDILLEMERLDLISDSNLNQLEIIFSHICPILNEKIKQYKPQEAHQPRSISFPSEPNQVSRPFQKPGSFEQQGEPETSTNSSNSSLVTKEVKVSENPPSEETKVSENLPSEETKVSENPPSEETKVSENLPSEETKVLENLPSEESKVLENPPSEESNVLENPPSEETKVSENLPSEETKVSENLPSEETKVSENLPSEETKVSENLPSEESNVLENLPSEETNVLENLPSEETKVSENLPSEETEDPPETPEDNMGLETYPMTATKRGICAILSNEDFSDSIQPLKYRTGTTFDEDRLKEVFQWLSFDVKIYRDCNVKEMRKALKKLSALDHSQMDCLVCCVLSHGMEGVVYGVGGYTVKIQEMMEPFDGHRCPSLAGKPKIFFVQACQGTQDQRGVVVKDRKEDEEDGVCTDAKVTGTIPSGADFLLGMATVPSYVSYRDKSCGSWYIQSLCQNLTKFVPRKVDLVTILTQVNADVSEKTASGWKKQMPQPAFSLRKRVVFPIPTTPSPDLLS